MQNEILLRVLNCTFIIIMIWDSQLWHFLLIAIMINLKWMQICSIQIEFHLLRNLNRLFGNRLLLQFFDILLLNIFLHFYLGTGVVSFCFRHIYCYWEIKIVLIHIFQLFFPLLEKRTSLRLQKSFLDIFIVFSKNIVSHLSLKTRQIQHSFSKYHILLI